MTGTDWIAVDWGRTRLRGWAMGRDGALLAEASLDADPRAADGFETVLLRLVAPWLAAGQPVPVIVSGMDGWRDAPLRNVPCAPVASGHLTEVPTKDPRISVRVIAGLSQSSPADLMRGEETLIAGFLAREPEFDGVLCLPGPHTKWVHISAGEVVSFQTSMTGELFALLVEHSALRGATTGGGWDEPAFAAALDAAISRPERIAARLFGLHAEAVLAGLTPAAARSRLLGLLIGIELAATRPYWLGQAVVILGGEDMATAYATGLRAQGLSPHLLPVTGLALAGLAVAYIRNSA